MISAYKCTCLHNTASHVIDEITLLYVFFFFLAYLYIRPILHVIYVCCKKKKNEHWIPTLVSNTYLNWK